MTLPSDIITTLKTLSDQEIVRRYGLPKHSIEIARRHHGIPSPPAQAPIQARVVRFLKSGPKTTREVAAALPDVSQVGERLKIMTARRQIVRHNRRWKVQTMAAKSTTPKDVANMTATEKASAKRRRRYPTFPALVAQGKTREEIEATLGISEYTARLLKAAFGITGTSEAFPGPGVRPSRPPRPERTPTITRAEIEARTHQRYEGVVAALQQRRTSADIAKEFGVTPQRVRQIAKKFGVKRPPVRLPKSRNAAGLTAWQQRQVENHPEILDASIPNSKMPGIGHTAVRNIRRALGMPATVKSSPVRDRIVAVVIRPMTVAEIATAIGSESMVALRLCLSVAARKGYINRVSLGVYAPTWWPMDGEK